jgi:hypothetical protein
LAHFPKRVQTFVASPPWAGHGRGTEGGVFARQGMAGMDWVNRVPATLRRTSSYHGGREITRLSSAPEAFGQALSLRDASADSRKTASL